MPSSTERLIAALHAAAQADPEDAIIKVSEYVTLKIGIPNTYSSAEINFGHSRSCRNDPEQIALTSTLVHDFNADVAQRQAEEYITILQSLIESVTP